MRWIRTFVVAVRIRTKVAYINYLTWRHKIMGQPRILWKEGASRKIDEKMLNVTIKVVRESIRMNKRIDDIPLVKPRPDEFI